MNKPLISNAYHHATDIIRQTLFFVWFAPPPLFRNVIKKNLSNVIMAAAYLVNLCW